MESDGKREKIKKKPVKKSFFTPKRLKDLEGAHQKIFKSRSPQDSKGP